MNALQRRDTGKNIRHGVLSGFAAAAAMHLFRSGWERLVGSRKEHGIFGFDEEADISAARMVYGWFSRREMSEREALGIALGLHYVLGTSLGPAYAVLFPDDHRLRSGGGLLFGLLLWLVADEIPISALRLSDPRKKSSLSHVSALAAHLIYGAVLEGGVRLLAGRTRKATRDSVSVTPVHPSRSAGLLPLGSGASRSIGPSR